MIKITDKRRCSGCKACSNACHRNAISFQYDNEGFFYPVVDKKRCIDCGMCERACPYSNENHGVLELNLNETPIFYAAQLIKKEELKNVSSGGAFQALAQHVIQDGGVVYGAAQEDIEHVFHIRASNLEELKRLRRSKYFQSDMGLCYKEVKQDLINGKKVLFSGTGCQIAGLYTFLHRAYDNLYTCEVVCHGVPSMKVWLKYKEEKETIEGKKIIRLVFRDKSKGWSNNQYKIIYNDGTTEYERSSKQLFHAGYLKGLFYRPSCGFCPFATLPRSADITLADFWKYNGDMRIGDMGVSLVALNNHQGKYLFFEAADLMKTEVVTKEQALDSCKHMNGHPKESRYREAFFKIMNSDGYYSAAKVFFSPNRFMCMIRKAAIILLRR